MDPKTLVKAVANAAMRGSVAPLVALYRLQLLTVPEARRDTVLQAWSQVLGLVPGLSGQFLRRAFYGHVLVQCHEASCINWGTVFSTRDVSIDRGVYLGARCMIGHAILEPHATIASNVDILSGKNQHHFDDPDVPLQEQGGTFERVRIGTNAWLGNGSIILADVGARSVVAAGAVVVNPVPDDVIVGGNPARILKRRDPTTGRWAK